MNVPGYKQEQDIPQNSRTETFAAITLHIESRRWAGVLFYIRTGKRLGRRVTEVAVVFKRAPHLPFGDTATEELTQNALVIRVQPDEGITMRSGRRCRARDGDPRRVDGLLHGGSFTESSPEAYERLILDAPRRAAAVPAPRGGRASWKILDPIVEYWESTGSPTPTRRAPGRPRPDARATDASGGDRDPTPPYPRPEGSRMIELTETTSSGDRRGVRQARRRAGSPAMGMVMTLVFVVDEADAAETMKAARTASREHPARVLGVILGNGRGQSRVDAQVGIGSGWTGETAFIRLSGEVTKHPESVVLPLLLPDFVGVVAEQGFDNPADDPLGRLARRRITDAAAVPCNKARAMLTQCRAYAPGNTDLAWTRITTWRALLAVRSTRTPARWSPRRSRRSGSA